jgi:CrcB protein
MERTRAEPARALVPLVALGGGLGALARYGLSTALPTADGGFPLATLLTNLAGCFALGLLVGALPHRTRLRALVGTGLLGGFTTFSTLALETDRLLVTAPTTALGYVAATTVGGLALARAGLRAGLRAGRR